MKNFLLKTTTIILSAIIVVTSIKFQPLTTVSAASSDPTRVTTLPSVKSESSHYHDSSCYNGASVHWHDGDTTTAGDCYSYDYTYSYTTTGYHKYDYVGHEADNSWGFYCGWCDNNNSNTSEYSYDPETEYYQCRRCGETISFRPEAYCTNPKCSHYGTRINGTEGGGTKPEDSYGCVRTGEIVYYSLSCEKTQGEWYNSDGTKASCTAYCGHIKSMELVNPNETVIIIPGQTPRVKVKVYMYSGAVNEVWANLYYTVDSQGRIGSSTRVVFNYNSSNSSYKTFCSYDTVINGPKAQWGYFNVSFENMTPSISEATWSDGADGDYLWNTKLTFNTVSMPGYTPTWYVNGVVKGTGTTWTWSVSENAAITFRQEPETYTLTFDTQGGTLPSGVSTTKSVTYHDTYGYLPEPVKDGFDFAGWALDGNLINNVSVVSTASDHTLTALWNSSSTGFFLYYDDTYGNAYDNGELPETLERPGYTFVIKNETLPSGFGWYFSELNNRGVLEQQILYNTINKWLDSARTVYSHWEPNRYNVTFICGTNTDMDTSVVINGAPDLDSTAFTTITFTSSKLAKKQVMYDMKYGTMPVPVLKDDAGNVRTDKVFLGWSTTGREEDIINETDTVKITNDIDVYAVFGAPANITVTLDGNGGKFGSSSTKTFTVKTGQAYGDTLNTLPTWNNHTFSSWSLDKNGNGGVITSTTNVASTKNVTLYAQWSAVVTFNTNETNSGNYLDDNGSSFISSVEGILPNSITFINGDSVNRGVPSTTISKEGYEFVGWSTEPNGTGTWYCSSINWNDTAAAKGAKQVIGEQITGNTTLYAQWKRITTKIYLNSMNGLVNDDTEQILLLRYGDYLTNEVEVPTKTGYIFKGFYTSKSGHDALVYKNDGSLSFAAPRFVKGETTVQNGSSVEWIDINNLYACWVPDEDYLKSILGNTDTWKGIHVLLEISNNEYDVKTAIPSTETVDIKYSFPKYVVKTTVNGNAYYFDLLGNLSVKYQDTDGVIKTLINGGTDTIYLDSIDSYTICSVSEADIIITPDTNGKCLKDISVDIPADDAVSITSSAMTEVVTNTLTKQLLSNAENTVNDFTLKLVLTSGAKLLFNDGDTVSVHTPVAITAHGIDLTLKNLYNEVTVKADNSGNHNEYSSVGYGLYNNNPYVNSLSGKLLLGELNRIISSGVITVPGNTITFPVGVWEKSSHKYYKAGTAIPIGLDEVTFIIPASTETTYNDKVDIKTDHGSSDSSAQILYHDARYGINDETNTKQRIMSFIMQSVASNANTRLRSYFGQSLTFTSGKTKGLEWYMGNWNIPSLAEQFANRNKENYTAFDQKPLVVRSGVGDIKLYLKAYDRTSGCLYWGEQFFFSIDTSGCFAKLQSDGAYRSENAHIELIPHYYDEDGNELVLYRYNEERQTLYKMGTDENISVNIIDVVSTANIPEISIRLTNDLTGHSVIAKDFVSYNLSKITLNEYARFLKDISSIYDSSYALSGAKDLNKDNIPDILQNSQSTWYGAFGIPMDTIAVEKSSTLDESKLLKDLLYDKVATYKGLVSVKFTALIYDENNNCITIEDALKLNGGNRIVFDTNDTVANHTDLIFIGK